QERCDERARLVLEAELHLVFVRRADRFDIGVLALAARADARRREDDLVVGGLYVLGGQFRAVVEFHALADLEDIDQAVGRYRPALGDRGRGLGAAPVVRVDPEERVVERGDRVDQPEGLFAVPVVGRRLR